MESNAHQIFSIGEYYEIKYQSAGIETDLIAVLLWLFPNNFLIAYVLLIKKLNEKWMF